MIIEAQSRPGRTIYLKHQDKIYTYSLVGVVNEEKKETQSKAKYFVLLDFEGKFISNYYTNDKCDKPHIFKLSQQIINKFTFIYKMIEIDIDKVFQNTCLTFGVHPDKIIGRDRHTEIAVIRHCLIHIVKKKTNLNMSEIGRIFKRDHSSILYAINNIDDSLSLISKYNLDLGNYHNAVKKYYPTIEKCINDVIIDELNKNK